MSRVTRLLFAILTALSLLFFWLSVIANYQDFLQSTLEDLIRWLSVISYLVIGYGPVFLIVDRLGHPRSTFFSAFTLYIAVMMVLNVVFYLYSRAIAVLSQPYGVP